LPFQSQHARSGEDARRKLVAQKREHAPGGVWSNLNKAAKNPQDQPRPPP
jgi:hypothetical protein